MSEVDAVVEVIERGPKGDTGDPGPPGDSGGGSGAVDSVNGQVGAVTLDADDVGAQPVDSDLTAIAALSTTPFGRALLELADAAAGRTALALGTAATHAHTEYETAGAAAAAQAASQPLDSDLTAIAALTTTSFGRAFLALADAAAGRTALGLGTAATQATGAFDAAGAAAAAQAASQPLDSDLTAIGGLSPTNDDVVQRKAGAWTNRSPAQLKTDLSLVKADVGLGNVDNTADTAKPVSTAQQTALDGKQPLDSDLTSIAALSTTSYGRSLLEASNASALRTLGGLVIGTDVAAQTVDAAAGTGSLRTLGTGSAQAAKGSDTEYAFSSWKEIRLLGSQIGSALAAGTYALLAGTSVANLFTSNVGLAAFYFDPANYSAGSRTTKLQLAVTLVTNAVAPGVTLTVEMYAVTANGGAVNVVSLTKGSVVSGASVAFATPSSSSLNHGEAEFTAPAAGYYAIAVINSGTTATNSTVAINTALRMRQT